MSEKIESMVDFLRQSGAQIRLFDMGRRVTKLSTSEFSKIEQGLTPYPLPFLHHAWIALMIWNPKQREQSVVWFLKLPLDERGFIQTAVRDDILHRLLKNIGNLMEQKEGEPDAMQDNPFAFKPDQEKMAIFHANATLTSGQPASKYYEYAQQYFAGQLGFADHWQGLGYQGIADLVIRHETGSNSAVLASAIPQLPDVPFEILCTCLENIEPDHKLFSALTERVEKTLSSPDCNANRVAAMVRGISNSRDQARLKQTLQLILESDYALEAEVIAAIATRCHETLQYPDLLKLFLERLAAGNAGQVGFSRVLADLMFMPALRALIMQVFRSPERSETLSNAIGEMFGSTFDN
ncbi:DUF3549 family protein [Marinobacterium jannaschii]|uniref:DUF3549 family protein n=1 Tax=Marinobacterium jannaschii TaxID=64970 RepID=UPI00047F3059|nr:DUF3549 family protein [Marinobacterium jannaschii]